MRIVIATPISPPDAGGPSYYSQALKEAFEALGHTVILVSFRDVRQYPTGIRHVVYAYRLFKVLDLSDVCFALDTWSVALPAVLVGKLVHKPVTVRSGGDFLWESYVARTQESVTLSEFYNERRDLTLKERTVFWITKNIIFALVTKIIFSTAWQQAISARAFSIPQEKSAVIENFYGDKKEGKEPGKKDFVWIGRDIFLKNTYMLEKAFEKAKQQHSDIELVLLKNVPQEKAFETLASCWAFILPSLSEVSPNLVLEALQFGRPCIVTQETGIRERLGDSVIYIDPKNEQDIAEKISMLADPEIREDYTRRAREFAYVHTYEDIAKEFLAVYKSL